MLKNSEFYPKSVRTSGQGLLQQMSELMTNFNDHAETELSASNDLSVLNELSEMLKDIISNIASIIKRNQNDLKETKNHLEESLNQLQSPETKTPKPIFEKIQAFNVSTGYKIGEIKSYHPNYEFSMNSVRPHRTRAFWVVTRSTRTCDDSRTARSRFESRSYTGKSFE